MTGSKHAMPFPPRLEHEITAIRGVPTTSERSQRICENLKSTLVRTSGHSGQLRR